MAFCFHSNEKMADSKKAPEYKIPWHSNIYRIGDIKSSEI